MSITVTVGLPFHNNCLTLTNAIRSVCAQTFQDWELILVDDGSTDGSLEIAKRIRDSRVRVLSDGVNRTLPARLNQIAECATGRYIARMDADDLMHPQRLCRQIEYLESVPSVDLVSSGIITIDANDTPVGTRACTDAPFSAREILLSRALVHPTILGRASWFRKNPYQNCGYSRAEDLELWCRTYLSGSLRAARLREPLYFYREDGAITLAKYLSTYATERRILREYGPRMVGTAGANVLVARSYTKAALCWLLWSIRRPMLMVNRRNVVLTDRALSEAAMCIDGVLKTRIAGLSGTEEGGL